MSLGKPATANLKNATQMVVVALQDPDCHKLRFTLTGGLFHCHRNATVSEPDHHSQTFSQVVFASYAKSQ